MPQVARCPVRDPIAGRRAPPGSKSAGAGSAPWRVRLRALTAVT